MNIEQVIEEIQNGEWNQRLSDVYVDEKMLDYQKKRYVSALTALRSNTEMVKFPFSVHPEEVKWVATTQTISMEKYWQLPLIWIPSVL